MKDKKILIIDDDINLCETVSLIFMEEGASVLMATDGREGLRYFHEHRPDLVLLDIRMPDINGWETCKQIRVLADTPIIMLTTMNQDAEIAKGLNYGADDFVTKPFSSEVLLARTNAVLRRTKASSEQTTLANYSDGHLSIDLAARRVKVDGELVSLTKTEFEILAYMLKHPDRVITYQNILHQIWGMEYTNNREYVQVHISTLRRKLEENPRKPRYILTEHGVGYRFQHAS